MPGEIRKASLSEFVAERDGQLWPGMHYPTRRDLLSPHLQTALSKRFRPGEIHDKGQESDVCNSAIYPDAFGKETYIYIYAWQNGFNIIEQF